MLVSGILLVIATFYAIVKKYETRVILIASGLLMASIGGMPMKAVDAFARELINASLTPLICLTMGFSLVIDYTGCSRNLVLITTGCLKKMKLILIPATVMLVWLMNIALISAAGLAAAVGAILIPTLIKSGVHPAMAGSAVLLGTWGSSVSLGNPFIVQVAQLAGNDMMTIIMAFVPNAFICALLSSLLLFGIAYVKKENAIAQDALTEKEQKEEINYLYAAIPLLPIFLLIVSSPVVGWIPQISVVNAMLLGTAVCLLVTRPDLKEFAANYFKGAGAGFSDIVCLIAAASVFVQGMEIIGLTGALIDAMRNSTSLAKISAVFGPFVLAAVSGSGNAAVLAFNGAVTPHAVGGTGVWKFGALYVASSRRSYYLCQNSRC